nr:hypothetical protein [Tanacetum cinerariifolium]
MGCWENGMVLFWYGEGAQDGLWGRWGYREKCAFDCNNAKNALCNARMNASINVNDLFVFDDVNIRKYHVSKLPFKKKPSASLNVPSKSKLNKSLPRIVRKWLPKLQPLAEPVTKWIPRVTRQID